VIWFDQRRRGPTGCVIGHGGLNTGVDEAVLLQVPWLNVKFRFADPWIDTHEANAKAHYERGGVEYPFQFLAWQLIEFLHVLLESKILWKLVFASTFGHPP
jgi:hypothetical protein